jgi:hypothetical protein
MVNDDGHILPENLLPNADYLKTLYSTQPQSQQKTQTQTQTQLQKQKFDEIDDETLYAICGPVYFDYTWIFKQNPALMQHILGVETVPDSASKSNQWTTREDPLTENKHYVNYGPQKDPSYPKMRFDTNPDRNPLPSNVNEFYVSPAQAMAELNNMAANVAAASHVTAAAAAANQLFAEWNTKTAAATGYAGHAGHAARAKAIYNWTTPGYHRYEVKNPVTIASGNRSLSTTTTTITNRFTQLMRPVGDTNGVQD